jgi:hypothetical protein
VVQIHIKNDCLNENNQLDSKKLDLVARLGGSWYARTTEDGLFEIPKPIATKGIGVDKLPKHIFSTNVLSGNNIGRLGNYEKIPTEDEIKAVKNIPEIAEILTNSQRQLKVELLHKKVKLSIENDALDLAVKLLFCL